mgnify:CR=1 FL=1
MKNKKSFFSNIKSILLAIFIALLIRSFIAEPFNIPSGSMIPTLLVGDHLFVSKSAYGIVKPVGSTPGYWYRWSEPQPGEVVVFEAPPFEENQAPYVHDINDHGHHDVLDGVLSAQAPDFFCAV